MAQATIHNAPTGGFQHGGWYWDPESKAAKQYNKDTGFGASTTINNPEQKGYGERVSEETQRQSGYVAPTGNGNAGSSSGVMGVGSANGQSDFNLEEMYSRLNDTEESRGAKAQLDNLDKELTDMRKSADVAISSVNDNPWFSEARRKGEIDKIESKYNSMAQTKLSEKEMATGKLARIQAEAETKMNLSLKQYDINRQEYQDQLQRFNFLLESGGLKGANDSDIATISRSLGIQPSMIDSILANKYSGGSAVSPQIITNTDDNGNVSFAVIDKKTGNIINQQSLGAVGKGTKKDNTIEQFNDTASSLKSINQNGVYVGTFPQLVAQFAPFMDLKDIYKNYLNTDLGKKYGAPKEDADFIQQVYEAGKGQVNDFD
jgi:hypothetical protein